MKLSVSQDTTVGDKIKNVFCIRNFLNYFITKIDVTRRNTQNIDTSDGNIKNFFVSIFIDIVFFIIDTPQKCQK